MPIDYGSVQGVDTPELTADEYTQEEVPEGIDNKLELPDTPLDYGSMHSAWVEYSDKVSTVQGFGAKGLQNNVAMLAYHLRLADVHLAKVRVSLDTVNGVVRTRSASTTSQRKIFTNFFAKLTPVQFSAQLKLFGVPEGDAQRSKEMVIDELVTAAMNGEE